MIFLTNIFTYTLTAPDKKVGSTAREKYLNKEIVLLLVDTSIRTLNILFKVGSKISKIIFSSGQKQYVK